MAKKDPTAVAQPKGAVAVPGTSAAAAPGSTELPPKVNTANLAELKLALDDKTKLILSSPSATASYGAPFVRSHFREDVRLAVGWASMLVAGVTAWYGYTADFVESKTLVGAGVTVYAMMSAFCGWWSVKVEKDIIFDGKRRSLIQGKIHTETLQIASSLRSRPSTPSSPLNSLLYHLSLPTSLSLSGPAAPPKGYPRYELKFNYVQLSSGGKSLIHQGVKEVCVPVGEVFDVGGRMAAGEVEKRVEGGVRSVLGL